MIPRYSYSKPLSFAFVWAFTSPRFSLGPCYPLPNLSRGNMVSPTLQVFSLCLPILGLLLGLMVAPIPVCGGEPFMQD